MFERKRRNRAALLDAGAGPNTLDPTGEPALWAAIRRGSVDAVRLLLDRKAVLDFKDSAGQTGLMVAVRENHPDIVQLLVERGAAVNAQTRTGPTPAWVLPNSVLGFSNGVGIVRGGLPERGSLTSFRADSHRYSTPPATGVWTRRASL